MRDSVYKITLDMHTIASQVQLTAKKNDNARKLIVTLMEDGKPYTIDSGVIAVFMMKKPDGTVLLNDCDIIDSGRAISYEFTTQTTASAGICDCEIRLIDVDETVITNPKFTILVSASVYDDGQVTSTSEFTTLNEALASISELRDIADRAEEAIEKAEDAIETAEDAADSVSDAASQVTTIISTASSYATTSKSYAVGGTGSRSGEDNDNSKYYKEICQQIASSIQGGFIPMGTVTFANLPTNAQSGWMYNVSDSFISDSRFKDGGGKTYASGTNVYLTADNMWDCLSGAIPTINGKVGNSITLDGSDIALTGYSKPSSTSAIATTDSINDAIGKLEKAHDTLNDDIETVDGKIDTEIANITSTADYTISTTWESNTDIGDYETYPYKQTISSTVYTTDRDCYVLGATPSSIPSKEECDEFGKLCQFVDFSNGVTVLASEETTVALTLRVRGV